MFDIAKEIASITEEYCRVNGINTEHPPVVFDKESLLYQSLLRVNQFDYDKHEYDEERYEQKERDREFRQECRERSKPL
jgi:hypothetical protein